MQTLVPGAIFRPKTKEWWAWKNALMMRPDCIERLAPEYQEALISNKLSKEDMRKIAFYNQFARGVILLVGEGGQGKTLTMTGILYHLKKYYGMPVISDYPLKPAFGEHYYMSTDDFIEELKRIDEQVKVQKTQVKELSDKELANRYTRVADDVLKQRGIVFDGAVQGWDEANRKLEASRANSRLVMIHRLYVQTWRHYQGSLVLATPEESDLTPKALNQVTIKLACGYDENLRVATAIGRNKNSGKPVVLRTFMPNFCDYYWTHAPISIRAAVMDFKGKKL